MLNQWHYQLMGETLGPVTSAELRKRVEDQEIQRDTLVRQDGTGKWVSADHVKGLFPEPSIGLAKRREHIGGLDAPMEEPEDVAEYSDRELVSRSRNRLSEYVYRMEQIPRNIRTDGVEGGSEASDYLQIVVDRMTAKGWDFFRVDTVGVEIPPGCLFALFGAKPEYKQYFVVTYRMPNPARFV